MVRGMYGEQLKDRTRSMGLMFMLGLNESIDPLAMPNSIRLDGEVLRGEDGHELRMELDLEAEGQKKKWRPKRTWKIRLRKKV